MEELEELLVQQKKKLREMAERQNVANEDSSSVESGFVSLAGREEEGGLVPGIGNRVRRRFSGRQRELTEMGGLYSNWGEQVGGGPSQGLKRVKIVTEEVGSEDVSEKAANYEKRCQGIPETVELNDEKSASVSIGMTGMCTSYDQDVDKKLKDDNNNAELSDKDEGHENLDSDSLEDDHIYGADSEELAALESLGKKFPASSRGFLCASQARL